VLVIVVLLVNKPYFCVQLSARYHHVRNCRFALLSARFCPAR